VAGHITKRRVESGKPWRARYPDPTRGGTAQIERKFDTKREAERWLNEQKVAVQRGTHIDPSQASRRFADIVDAWRGTWIELEPKTKAGYDNMLNKHVLPRWRDAQIGAVSADSIQAWVNELAESGRAPGTIAHVYGVVRSVLRVAVERRYITINPCDAVRLPRRSSYGERGAPKEMLFLTAPEVQQLAEAIDPHYRVLVYTAAYSGMRAGELGALRRRDVDLLHGRLNVNRALKEINSTSPTLSAGDKGLIFGATKTGKCRVIGVPCFLVAMLTDHLASIPSDPDALVFTANEGGPLRHSNFYRRHFKPTVRRRYCVGCGTTVQPDDEVCPECEGADLIYILTPRKHGLRFHDLRHTCAALLIAADAHPKAIQDHLGHRDIQTTFNVYGHMLPAAQEALAAALDAAYTSSGDLANIRRLAP
jgi:integrase